MLNQIQNSLKFRIFSRLNKQRVKSIPPPISKKANEAKAGSKFLEEILVKIANFN
jgi:hypothetical protein